MKKKEIRASPSSNKFNWHGTGKISLIFQQNFLILFISKLNIISNTILINSTVVIKELKNGLCLFLLHGCSTLSYVCSASQNHRIKSLHFLCLYTANGVVTVMRPYASVPQRVKNHK